MQIIVNAENPEKTARAIVQATTHFNDPAKLAEICTGLGTAMKGENDLNRPGLVSECRFLRISVECMLIFEPEMSERGY